MDFVNSLKSNFDFNDRVKDLFEFVLKKEMIQNKLIVGRLRSDDERLLKRVSRIIKNYLVDIEKLLDKPNREYSTQYITIAETAKLGENILEILKVELDVYVAIFINQKGEIFTNLSKYSGINYDTRKFLQKVRVRLEEYQEDIEFILSKR